MLNEKLLERINALSIFAAAFLGMPHISYIKE